MLRPAFFFCCIFLSGLSFSQFSDSVHYHISYAATGTINKATEGKSYVVNNAFVFEVSKKKVSLNNSNSWVYGETNGQKNINDFSSTLNFDVNRALKRWYYWGLASYTTSYSLQIENQFQVGGGTGINAIRKPHAELVISDGIIFESSNLYETVDEERAFMTLRNSLRVKYRFVIKNVIVIDGMHFWQPAFNDISNYIVRSGNNLSVMLNKWLGVTTSVSYNRYNQTDRENLLINFGLTVQKYF